MNTSGFDGKFHYGKPITWTQNLPTLMVQNYLCLQQSQDLKFYFQKNLETELLVYSHVIRNLHLYLEYLIVQCSKNAQEDSENPPFSLSFYSYLIESLWGTAFQLSI